MGVISCKDYARLQKIAIAERIEKLGGKPTLCIIQVGDNEAGDSYIKGKCADCDQVGIECVVMRLDPEITQEEIEHFVSYQSCVYDGLIVQLPLPKHIDSKRVADAISKDADVDGFKVGSRHKPCTPKGIIDWLKFNGFRFRGKNAVVFGRSEIVGKPLVNMLIDEGATVTCCNSSSKKEPEFYTRDADLVVTATGKIGLINKDMISDSTSFVVDVGINRDGSGKLCGDVNPDGFGECLADTYLTPVPGGVGLLTRVALLQNVLNSYEMKMEVLNG